MLWSQEKNHTVSALKKEKNDVKQRCWKAWKSSEAGVLVLPVHDGDACVHPRTGLGKHTMRGRVRVWYADGGSLLLTGLLYWTGWKSSNRGTVQMRVRERTAYSVGVWARIKGWDIRPRESGRQGVCVSVAVGRSKRSRQTWAEVRGTSGGEERTGRTRRVEGQEGGRKEEGRRMKDEGRRMKEEGRRMKEG